MSDDVREPDFWNDRYATGSDGWDLGEVTPALVDWVTETGAAGGEVIVLGAGRGYDGRWLAARGWEVTAVDFAAAAVAEMEALATAEAPMRIMQANIFELPADLMGRFDYVWEYTCFCAIDPSQRADYADLVYRLLRPGGLWVGLVFPIGTRPGGPPFTVQPDVVISLLGAYGLELVSRQRPVRGVEGRVGVEELVVMRKGE
ncbi:MAG TPA: methyltransferase domain-containing protein [Anaerolineae bacterium]|nr:methyltransferase domain-containing protein [Anaerolineae bacterium]